MKRYNDMLPEFKKTRSEKSDRERIEDLEIAMSAMRRKIHDLETRDES